MIQFREIIIEDVPSINRWRNDPEVMQYLTNQFRYIGLEADRNWFAYYQQHRDQAVRLAIVDDAMLIGTVQLTQIDRVNQQAEYSIMIGEKNHQSKGIGRLATEEILRHGFNDLNLHRIYLTVLPENDRAIRLYESFGFQQEGLYRKALFKNGQFTDVMGMSLLRNEFQSR
ncbi:GNAT family N-acetyltransferase [Siphonobacter curvatus]|uniref:UDP-4-amino-4, 6-dideoxy-N-acetyl-beta-L-altrosamine N-acetyltransferase n=1 Tax=Siphonobacter curvatus TaxID=2094562 RepID=A0A2S7IQS1_9BACT|nr:GNAT family protein [Siphonobacter curvatus]PQA60073.1 UDP-4-amino-4,6-dideoxy-N-acetyl-beta-L-altrosamine N-acetyltransferase [Siphonobacter curvatus]